jgi:DNA polymerase III subunit gamma/tau
MPEEENRPEDSFTEDDLLVLWEKLKDHFKNTSASIFTAFNTHPPVLADDFTIEVGVDNAVQQDNIFEQRPQILTLMRQTLNNYSLNFKVIVKEAQKVQKAYLPAEKYQKMQERNPLIDKLKNDLDLDIIY